VEGMQRSPSHQIRDLGKRYKLPSGVVGKNLAAKSFDAFCVLQTSSFGMQKDVCSCIISHNLLLSRMFILRIYMIFKVYSNRGPILHHFEYVAA